MIFTQPNADRLSHLSTYFLESADLKLRLTIMWRQIGVELGWLVLVLKKCNFHFWRFLKSQPRTNNDHFTLMEQTKTPFSPS